MDNNSAGCDGAENFSFSAQGINQFHTIGAPPLQMGQEVREAVKSVIQSLIPEVVEAVRLQCAREFRAVVPELIEARCLQRDRELRAFISEQFEELKKIFHSSDSSSSPTPHRAPSSGLSRSYRLHLVGNMPDELVTLTDIQDRGASLKVELRDNSGSIVQDGTESRAKVKTVVLDGDFEAEDADDWTLEDFNAKVAEPRKDKGPLLRGNYELSLSKGVANVGKISFTDNSSKLAKNGYFKLGVQVVKGLHPGGVREAVSKRFKVKERRGQSFHKSETPSLEDDIYLLRNIKEKGIIWQRLVGAEIHKVKDFIQLYHTDEKELQKIAQVSGKKWQGTVDHAKLCSLTNDKYVCRKFEEGVDVLVLDSVFKFVSVILLNNDQSSLRYDKYDNLNASQKELVNKARRKAYDKRSELPKTCSPVNQILGQVETLYPTNIPFQQTHMQNTYAGGQETLLNYSNWYASEAFPSHLGQPVVHQTQTQTQTQTPDFEFLDALIASPCMAEVDSFMASTSHTQAMIHREDEAVTGWTSVLKAVVKFKIIAIRISVKQGSTRALKKQKLE